MSVGLYFDVHVRRAISNGLRMRGVDVLTAQEDGAAEYEDPELLDRSTAEQLFRFLTALDQDVEIVIRRKPRSRRHTRVSVIAA